MNVVEVVDTIFLTEGNTCHKENSISIDKHKEMKIAWSKNLFFCVEVLCTYIFVLIPKLVVLTVHTILYNVVY